jgi:adenine phosphoribosyltransferase
MNDQSPGAVLLNNDLRAAIRTIPDFPKPGIMFRDITTLIKDPILLRRAVDALAEHYRDARIEMVIAVESRGFILGVPLAYKLGAGFVPVRKPGKLPAPTARQEYTLEYGSDAVEVHRDAITPGARVLLHDDLLATGGTILAATKLVELLGGDIAGISFLVELSFLNGRKRLGGREIFSLIQYDSE